MSKIKVAIIEDEYPAARLLNSMLLSLRNEWEIIIIPGTIEDAVEWFAVNNHPDLIFLDIHLTDGNSFMFIEQAKPESLIIFTTAYDEYAIRAFSVNSIDYLLKPIHNERLLESIEKFERLNKNTYIREYKNEELLEVLKNVSSTVKKFRTRFLVSRRDEFFTLQVEDIAYFYSENKCTFAVTKSGDKYLIEYSLDKLSEQLDPDIFFRTNRQSIVSINSIKSIEPYFQNKIIVQVKPKFDGQILISREKIAKFKIWLNY